MTKTSKPAAITFPSASKGVKRNIETGVEIHGSRGEYAVVVPSRDHRIAPRVFRTLAEARVEAITQVEMWREAIADAYDSAAEVLLAEIKETAQDAAPLSNRAFGHTLSAARRSVKAGFLGAAARRLNAARNMLAGVGFVSDEDADRALADALIRMSIGTTVRTDRGVADVIRHPYIDAETGRVVLPLSFLGKGYGSAYADAVTVA